MPDLHSPGVVGGVGGCNEASEDSALVPRLLSRGASFFIDKIIAIKRDGSIQNAERELKNAK